MHKRERPTIRAADLFCGAGGTSKGCGRPATGSATAST